MKIFKIYGLIVSLLFFFSGNIMATESYSVTNKKDNFSFSLNGGHRHVDLTMTKVLDKKIENPDLLETLKNNTEMDQFNTQLKANYGIYDNIDIFGAIGIVNIDYTNACMSSNTKGQRPLFQIGFKSVIPITNGFSVGILGSLSRARLSNNVPDQIESKIKYDEFSSALYLIKKWDKVSMYGGMLYSKIDLKVLEGLATNYEEYNFTYLHEMKDNIGAILGFDYFINEDVILTLNTQLINQNSFDVGLSYNF